MFSLPQEIKYAHQQLQESDDEREKREKERIVYCLQLDHIVLWVIFVIDSLWTTNTMFQVGCKKYFNADGLLFRHIVVALRPLWNGGLANDF
jgi:hypothetical protein